MTFMEIITFIETNWEAILLIYTSLVTIASIIIKFTPTLKDDEWLGKFQKFVAHYIALNKKQ